LLHAENGLMNMTFLRIATEMYIQRRNRPDSWSNTISHLVTVMRDQKQMLKSPALSGR